MQELEPLPSDWISADGGPTAKVGGEPPGRVWGSGFLYRHLEAGSVLVVEGRWPAQFLVSAGFAVLDAWAVFVMCAGCDVR